MEKTLIIIPTYNEINNIKNIVQLILDSYDNLVEILIVDDNSPDGTGTWVEEESKKQSRLHILKREKKLGLGTAYCAGFQFALENDFDYIMEMDADFSHDPKEIGNFLIAIGPYDLVVGSRYLKGITVVNWPMQRLLLSWFANKYTRLITGLPISDATGGFKCFRRRVLEAIDLNNIHSNGYSFQIEMTFKAWKKGFKIGEIPIVFTEREKGSSKMSKKIVWEAVFMVWKLRIKSILGILK
ncbi:MAG TPA: polyprenol monophosphomannose synthase [Ignavibacteriaceae bacterium]|jgi:dolichol-phosphate mannosyltransferase|nr:polyprenol monophosphomannose synthase [Ignavibacteriaceae bacterium]HOJ17071.1 polyprenol monophosphomannose synthase [Ignavibacteriaceae bacterium]